MDRKIAKFINKIKPFSNKERENLRKMAKNDERWTLSTSYDFDDEAITETIELGDKVLEESTEPGDEFCPKCYADLTMQRGYNRPLAYWTCLGCTDILWESGNA